MRAPRRGETPPVSGSFGRSSGRIAAAVLASGGIAVFPTDTIYGFHCAISNRRAIGMILELKGRRKRGGFILLAADAEMAGTLVAHWPGESRKRLSRIWPAPLTAVLPARRTLSPFLSPGGKVAVRVPARADLRALIERIGEPIVSTSVNLSGREPMARIADIRRAFPGLGAYLSRRGRSPALPSTIVDFTVDPPLLVRPGGYPWPAAV
ncbi:MAG: L-threonylcarbamoyladenylate synthase [Candidatus Krumholzibacteria bacterium]|nr:L-threonylcarbamoyladenylate synthase [Candidatus Krumholzibacteria bacterium]